MMNDMRLNNNYENCLQKRTFSLLDAKRHQRMLILGDLGDTKEETRPSFDLLDAKQKQRLEILGKL